MKKFTYYNKTYNIPTEWEDITLSMHAKCAAIVERGGPASLVNLKRMIVLTGIDAGKLKTMPKDQFLKVFSMVNFYFITKVPAVDVSNGFEFEGQRYEIPTDIAKSTFGEFVDYDTAFHDNQNLPWNGVADMCAIYCRPPGEAYDIDKYDERRELFKQLPLPIAEGLAAFFLRNEQVFRTVFQVCLIDLLNLMERTNTLRNSQRSMAGWRRLTSYPKVKSIARMRLRLKRVAQSLSGSSFYLTKLKPSAGIMSPTTQNHEND